MGMVVARSRFQPKPVEGRLLYRYRDTLFLTSRAKEAETRHGEPRYQNGSWPSRRLLVALLLMMLRAGW